MDRHSALPFVESRLLGPLLLLVPRRQRDCAALPLEVQISGGGGNQIPGRQASEMHIAAAAYRSTGPSGLHQRTNLRRAETRKAPIEAIFRPVARPAKTASSLGRAA